MTSPRTPSHHRPRPRWRLAGLLPLALACAPLLASAGITLSDYRLVGRHDLPTGSSWNPGAGQNLLAAEVSAVTWNWDTNTLFVLGDGGTAVVQLGLDGRLIDSMTLGADASRPQGTAFYDPEGLTYVGNGRFVLAEERDRRLNLLTYTAGTVQGRAGVQSVKLGTTVGNIGIEGISRDPLSGGLVVVQEKSPQALYLTTPDFPAGTASNGSPTTLQPLNLFNPALAGVLDLADVYALSNLPSNVSGSDAAHLLVLSEESGRIVEIGRDGQLFGSLALTVAGQHEGLTMDALGRLYVVGELSGPAGGSGLWVYAPVPEPQTWALMAAGLALLPTLRRRKT